MNKVKVYLKVLAFSGFLVGAAWAGSATAATLSVSPTSQNINNGQNFTVSIMLNTSGQSIAGSDVFLNFNPSILQVVDADSNTGGVQVSAGSLMQNTLVNSVDNGLGKISLSQVASAGSTFTGSGVLATVNFRAVAAGTSPVTFDFTLGSTVDSNIAIDGEDILSEVGNAGFTILTETDNAEPTGNNPDPVPTPATPSSGSSSYNLRLINNNGTFYLIKNGKRQGITNPGMLFSYGFEFKDAAPAGANDLALPQDDLLTPGEGSLVKTAEDPTVYLISGGQRHGFTSAQVFTALGFKFGSVLVVTAPELNKLPVSGLLDNPTERHKAGSQINHQGTIYWLSEGFRHPYPSLAVYNSWNLDNDFSSVVPANNADLALPVGSIITFRALE